MSKAVVVFVLMIFVLIVDVNAVPIASVSEVSPLESDYSIQSDYAKQHGDACIKEGICADQDSYYDSCEQFDTLRCGIYTGLFSVYGSLCVAGENKCDDMKPGTASFEELCIGNDCRNVWPDLQSSIPGSKYYFNDTVIISNPSDVKYFNNKISGLFYAPNNMGGNYYANNCQIAYKVYAYKIFYGEKAYNSVPVQGNVITTDNTNQQFYVDMTWNPAAGADGYALLKKDSCLGWNYDYYIDVGNQTYFVDSSTYGYVEGTFAGQASASLKALNVLGHSYFDGRVTINDVMKLTPKKSAPQNPELGELYVDRDSSELCFYNGISWIGIANGGQCS